MENEPEIEPADVQPAAGPDEDVSNQDVRSIEINLNSIKTFFVNTISLYESLIRSSCQQCNVINCEEFVNLHKNLCEFENIFKVFDVSFNKGLLANILKIKEKKPKEAENSSESGSGKFPCFINSCKLAYTTEDGAKIHFIKNHCKKGDLFEIVQDENLEINIEFSQIPRDDDGRYLCEVGDCSYASSDRSNFKVHMKRHIGDRRYICVCGKKFFTRDPLMVHFVRVHMKDVKWDLATRDIRTLRKTIRRMINRKYCFFESNDDIPDSDSDLNGPIDEENEVLNDYITQAICDAKNQETASRDDELDESGSRLDGDDDEEAVNSFDVSISLKDKNYFTDSVTLKSEGISEKIDDLITKNPSELIKTRVANPTTKGKMVNKEIRQRVRNYKCPHKACQQEFFTTKNLLIHLKASHDPANPIPCTEAGCSSRFKSIALLAQHQKRHNVQYSCSVCSYKTHLAALMTRHNRQHAGEQLFHECTICHEKFEYLGALSSHRRKVHNEVEPLACEWPGCQKRFKTIIGLKKHKRELHMKMKAEIPCEWPECSAVFSNRSAMTNHMRIHTNERPYQCTWQDCGKWFRLKETLKRHIKLHQGYKPYVCPFDNCDMSFFNKRNMKSHIEKVHLINASSDQPMEAGDAEPDAAAEADDEEVDQTVCSADMINLKEEDEDHQ